MSKLSEVFGNVFSTLHWGPSVEPFHRAVIEEHDALEQRVAALEKKWDDMYPSRPVDAPKYIAPVEPDPVSSAEPVSAAQPETTPVPSESDQEEPEHKPAPADEQNPAEPVQTPVSDLPEAQPEPVPAGPVIEGDPIPEAPEQAPEPYPVPEQSA